MPATQRLAQGSIPGHNASLIFAYKYLDTVLAVDAMGRSNKHCPILALAWKKQLVFRQLHYQKSVIKIVNVSLPTYNVSNGEALPRHLEPLVVVEDPECQK